MLLQFLKFKSLVEEWAIFLPSSVDDVIKCHRMGNFSSMLLKLVKLSISYCGPSCLWVWLQPICAGFVRVLENLESPGILFWPFPGWKVVEQRLQVLESPGNLSKSSNKVFQNLRYKNSMSTVRKIDELMLKSWLWKGRRGNLETWRNQPESWKSLEIVLEICS